MRILILSYLELHKEGRLLRAYDTLKKKHDVVLIDVADKKKVSSNKVSVTCKSTINLFRNIQYCLKSIFYSRNMRFDAIYAHNYFTALPGLVISLLYGKKLYYDAYELYYPKSKENFSLRDYIFYFFEKLAIKNAVKVSCASEERALIMVGHYNLSHIPVVIKNISNNQKDIMKKELEPNKKCRIVYAGFLADDRFLLETLNKIKSSDICDEIQFDVYGRGPLSEKLKQFDEEDHYSFFKFKGSYKNIELDSILKNYHVGYIAYPNKDYNNIFCSPNKLLDYITNGLPVVAPYNYTLDKEINNNNIGVCSENLVVGIKEVMDKYDFYSNNLNGYLQDNLWKPQGDKLEKIFRK